MKMECMEARALKSSFSSELALNLSCFPEDYLCVTTTTVNNNNNICNALPSDDFSIDDFFDLPNENNEDGGVIINDGEIEEKDGCCSFSFSSYEDNYFEEDNSTHFSTELAIPVDDVQELELWSHLMDDSSIPEPTIACPKPVKTGFNFVNRVEPVSKPGSVKVPVITSAVPVKPRSKRLRIGNRSWIFNSSPRPESSSSSSSSASSPVSTLFFPPPVHEFGVFFTFGKPPVEKKKKKPVVFAENPPVQRRCSHCQVTKTPQWRAGPNGPKTLCNACGVRFKSGRLFPEYRPACSPTFSSEVHSNSHRKVLEMRRKKEVEPLLSGSLEVHSNSGSTSTVLSSQRG